MIPAALSALGWGRHAPWWVAVREIQLPLALETMFFPVKLEDTPVIVVQRQLSSVPFNGTVRWHVSKLTAVKKAEKKQIISPKKFQSSSWIYRRTQFLRFHLLFFWKPEAQGGQRKFLLKYNQRATPQDFLWVEGWVVAFFIDFSREEKGPPFS